MTTFLYSSLSNGASIDFDPNVDVLRIDTSDYSAADFSLTVTSEGSGLLIANGAKQFTLVGASFGALTSGNIDFADGSVLVSAALQNNYASELVGTSHDDLLIGSPGQQELQLAAISTEGEVANSLSTSPKLSADGRFVVFTSYASNLVDGDNGNDDLFMKDLLTGELVRVSETATGASPVYNNSYRSSYHPAVSADGRYVAFQSLASNLVADDTNGSVDIFMKDLQTGAVTRISTSSSGAQANTPFVTSFGPSISADGRYVAFESHAHNLVSGDTNGAPDVFVKDTFTGELTRVSTDATGQQANGGLDNYGSSDAKISADGRFVVFRSYSTNLVAGDDNGDYGSDIFVKNLATGEIVCVSTDIDGNFVDSGHNNPTISADGRFVTFERSSEPYGTLVRDLQTGELRSITGRDVQLSGDGRFAVFRWEFDVFDGDTNHRDDIFVLDLVTNEIARVSIGVDGVQSEHDSMMPTISLDGSTISFRNDGGADLVNGDTSDHFDDRPDVFVVSNPLYERTLSGGAGHDSYIISNVSDRVVELADQGSDLVRSFVTYTLPDNVERLVLSGNVAIDGTGNALDNEITGNSAANSLSGAAGADTMIGAGGNDTYYVDSSGDVVVEVLDGGTDKVRAAVDYVLQANVENLVLTGTSSINGTGNSDANKMAGNSGDNRLDGVSGIDTLDFSAAGAAVTIDLSVTTAQATGGAGTDTVLGFENLLGSDYADTLAGTSATNVIDGGAGADSMTGGAGDDIYVVDNAGDEAVEIAASGTDTIQSSVTFALQAEVENLTLTGTSAINGTGNALDNILIGNTAANVLTGGAGNDTYVVDNVGDQTIEAAAGGSDTVQSYVTFTLQAEVENLTLTGTSAINGTGNSLANTIIGNAAANVLNGAAGADTMTGGAGNDSYVVDNAGDKTIEVTAGGSDTVQSSATFTLQSEIENLALTGTSAINGSGNSLANTLTGNAASNVLNGGAGVDTMTGGAGNDTYVVDNASDKAIEAAAGGTDLVQSSVTFTLQAEVENLTLAGASTINGTGNSLANTIIGNAASNVLNGGAGADTMTGGAGNDTYVVDNASDKTIEAAAGGTDTVQSSITFALQTEVENLTLTGTFAINATGNSLANTITGNAAANVLNGAAGADTMTGGAGNDTYVVDNAGDKAVEGAAGGSDTVQSSITFTLQTEVERLTLTGTSAINGSGNSLANTITGNAASNVLNGASGADSMTGGAGNDTYVVDNAGDKTIEAAAGGSDTVQSSVTFTLQAEVEKLTLTGSAATSGTGNTVGNTLIGNASANTLDGKAGADTLTGGAGADIFALTSSLGSDLVTDFTSGADKLRLSQAAIRIGDGDTIIEGASAVTGPNGFGSTAELVVVTHNIAGSITAASAATAVGHANNAYHAGDTRLFVVDNGSDSAVYLFKSANADSVVSANELSLLITLDNTASTAVTDYLFGT
jgi:Ca2+-binding RTX toxin-like protein